MEGPVLPSGTISLSTPSWAFRAFLHLARFVPALSAPKGASARPWAGVRTSSPSDVWDIPAGYRMTIHRWRGVLRVPSWPNRNNPLQIRCSRAPCWRLIQRADRCPVSPFWRSGRGSLGLIDRGCDARRTVDQQPFTVKRCRAGFAATAEGADAAPLDRRPTCCERMGVAAPTDWHRGAPPSVSRVDVVRRRGCAAPRDTWPRCAAQYRYPRASTARRSCRRKAPRSPTRHR